PLDRVGDRHRPRGRQRCRGGQHHRRRPAAAHHAHPRVHQRRAAPPFHGRSQPLTNHHSRRSTLAALTFTLAATLLTACATGPTRPYSPQTESQRDPAKAQRLTQEAAAIIDADPAKAEVMLREALTADLYHGPAHNNLGVIFLKRNDLFSAAGEFEWARKL